MSKYIYVLSGGGAKGMYQATVLKELFIKGKYNRPNLIVGSSVGGINGAALGSEEITPLKLWEQYPRLAKKIFDRERLFAPIYSRNNFLGAWNSLIRASNFGDLRIKTIISSVDFVEKKQHYFKSWIDKNIPLTEVIMRGFAAPYYFGRMNDPKNKRVWGDGGMGYDNLPITEAIMETIVQGWIHDTEDVNFIVIGTGFQNIVESYEKVADDRTFNQLFDFMIPKEGGLARVLSRQNQIGQLVFLAKNFNNIHFKYYDCIMSKKIDKMDNIKALDKYIDLGIKSASSPLMEM